MSRVARLLLLAIPAWATAVSVNTQSSIVTHYGCSTRVACTSHEGPVPTSTVCSVVHTKHTIEQVTTTTPVTTVTGHPTTKLVTETATTTVTLTEPTLTGTYTSTSTVDSTVITTVATITSTETDNSGATVSSTVTSTTTIATPAGYVGVNDSTGEQNAASGSQKKGRSLVDSSRQLAAERRRSDAAAAAAPAKRAAAALPKGAEDFHPQQVLCTLTVETLFTVHSTRYAPTRTVSKCGPTVTASSTTTTTSTSIVIPSATTTVTVTSTSTITSSATETDTSTVLTTATVVATSTSTVVGACATNFILGPNLANGQGVENFSQTNQDYGISQIDTATAYDCCVACQNDNGAVCWASWFQAGTTICLLVEYDGATAPGTIGPGGTCDPSYDYGSLQKSSDPGQYIIANGPCGSLAPP